jgi:PD-(D/E)XK nuclease superfamily protein
MNTYLALATDITERIIGCAIEVHRHLGPGLLESVYESALCLELESVGLSFARQVGVPVFYKGELIAEHRPNLITGLRVGLILNFNRPVMKEGVRRVSLRE